MCIETPEEYANHCAWAAVQGGAFVGVIAIFFVNERFGRRISLLASGALFNIGVVFQMACQGNIPLFYVGRFVTGLGIGGASFVIPQFLSECAPPASRGGIIGTVGGSDDTSLPICTRANSRGINSLKLACKLASSLAFGSTMALNERYVHSGLGHSPAQHPAVHRSYRVAVLEE